MKTSPTTIDDLYVLVAKADAASHAHEHLDNPAKLDDGDLERVAHEVSATGWSRGEGSPQVQLAVEWRRGVRRARAWCERCRRLCVRSLLVFAALAARPAGG
jgi:hypothetical protein